MARPTRHHVTKVQKSVTVTPDSWESFDKIANEFMLSRSELIEMIGQGRLKVVKEENQAA
ncbi:hypothetical protein HW132_28645 [Brasilonema sp. CT11]|nr:hypothetical protein [Brasilonema sp. CT11]